MGISPWGLPQLLSSRVMLTPLWRNEYLIGPRKEEEFRQNGLKGASVGKPSSGGFSCPAGGMSPGPLGGGAV